MRVREGRSSVGALLAPSANSHLSPLAESLVQVEDAQVTEVRHAGDRLQRVKPRVRPVAVVLYHEAWVGGQPEPKEAKRKTPSRAGRCDLRCDMNT